MNARKKGAPKGGRQVRIGSGLPMGHQQLWLLMFFRKNPNATARAAAEVYPVSSTDGGDRRFWLSASISHLVKENYLFSERLEGDRRVNTYRISGYGEHTIKEFWTFYGTVSEVPNG